MARTRPDGSTYYCTTLIKGRPIGWTPFRACNILYAQRAAAYREKDYIIGDREGCLGIERNGQILALYIRLSDDDCWTDIKCRNLTFEKTLLEPEKIAK